MTLHWIKFAVSAGGLALLLWWTDAPGVLARLQGVDHTWTLLALLSVTAATFAMASRWMIVARAFDIHIPFLAALREYYLAQLINLALPGGVAGDVTRAVRARQAADLKRAAQSVMAERLLGQIVIMGFMLLGFVGAVVLPGGLNWGGLGWFVPGLLVVSVIGALAIAKTDTATARFVRMTGDMTRQPVMLVHGAVTTFCLIFGFYACARATGVVLPVEAWATLIPLVLTAMLIPLSIGGWGWREGAAAALFPLIGAPASAGVATGITYGLVLVAATLPAAVFLLLPGFSSTLSTKGKADIS
ncbi:flippase-like domain-containing protein [Tateyamaria omphalii]|uniref:lysylphosphatidylglycerol synthase transmembrane domain-containing protein n=1 Tax=Tateyamaria omphalii TaxID=299262 RepID=UPI001C991098|nr:lysylphosphatidylglycerol synthase transmembrane domain-containing protein [Tateyamaria omphalii]MBY5935596.1 flippase-like domain-containing protein [Tateyamaria omphalii]